ncbi:hypothetical protein ACFVVC_01895 [Pseudarthrobacter sp. NPDC058196]|uniref:hypothetical protein n=1 Tax=Pseudarthrobacter sp. NPDC058196 TaxID=3346376 RepID=UPI0036DF1D38
MHKGPISNGMRLNMTPEQRNALIGSLSPEVRSTLAHIASLGAARETQKAAGHIDAGRRAWAGTALGHAQSLSRLAVELTRGPREQ